MTLRKHSTFFILAMFAATSMGAVACSSNLETDTSDDALSNATVASSGYEIDVAKANQLFPDPNVPIREGHPEDAFSVVVDLGGKKIVANTHMFTQQVNIIPYANPEVEGAVATSEGGHGDAIIAKYIKPGEVGFMVKNHRPVYRSLAFDANDPEMKENFKLQDTHVGIIVGVNRGGVAGAISINNPKRYEQGAFGEPEYPMVFVKPTFPQGVTADQQKLYFDNIRTMAVLFNTVSSFPGDYNGGDPLGARNPTEVKRHVAMMVKAIGGDTQAQAFFSDPQNMIYCAELAHVAASAGILVPLNKQNVVGLKGKGDAVVTEADWSKFISVVAAKWPFNKSPLPSSDTGEPNDRLADLAGYKPDFAGLSALKPIDSVARLPAREDGQPAKGLAFEPMTMADVVQHFLRTHIPRDPDRQQGTALEGTGEGIAPMQAAVLAKMEPGLYETMKLDANNPQRVRSIADDQLMSLPQRVAGGEQVKFTVKDVFDAIVKVVGKSYGSYQEFQVAVQPWLVLSRNITGPRGDSGEGLFVPPSLLHVIAQGGHPGGYLGLQYLGHGMHFSIVKKTADTPAAPAAPSGPAAPAFQPTRN